MSLYIFRKNDKYLITDKSSATILKKTIFLNNIKDDESTIEYIDKIKRIYYTCEVHSSVSLNTSSYCFYSPVFYTYCLTDSNEYHYLKNNSMSLYKNQYGAAAYSFYTATYCKEFTNKQTITREQPELEKLVFKLIIPTDVPTSFMFLTKLCSSYNEHYYKEVILPKAQDLLKNEFKKFKKEHIDRLNAMEKVIDKGSINNEKHTTNYPKLDVSKIQYMAEKFQTSVNYDCEY